ncbi:uncharacterized protein LOC143053794 [Mytilus galloprovincialis]|uniref:uncharacterized protein LOC143053794 n=1 Tax=Mytilus galloprovincialis TaxID=29158 RepID=UPI003F7C5896
MEENKEPAIDCSCGMVEQAVVFEDNGDLDNTTNTQNTLENLTLSSFEKSDVDTDSLESLSVTSSILPEVMKNGIIEPEVILSNGKVEDESLDVLKNLKNTSGSSFSNGSSVSNDDSPLHNSSLNKSKTGNMKGPTTGKKLFKNKTFDFSHVKSRTNSNFHKFRDINKPISPSDRRLSESCILQTSLESHGIRETRLSRSRFERCHVTHDGIECEGNDYLTPTQKKDNLIRDLKNEVKELKKLLSDKTREQESDRNKFEKKIEIMMAEKGTEIVIFKSDIETLGKKNEDLVKSYQVSVNTINILEDTIRELKEAMAEKERNNEKVFLETYKKGQMSALFERNEELERIAVSCDGSRITIKELLQKLLLTETELGKWQSIRRQESYDEAPKPETEAAVTLRFLKDAFFHYATDTKDCDFHLRAMIRILNFTDVQKKKIADSIVSKRKHKNSSI